MVFQKTGKGLAKRFIRISQVCFLAVICVSPRKKSRGPSRLFVKLSMTSKRLRVSNSSLSPPQRPLSCCFFYRGLIVWRLRIMKNRSVQEMPEREKREDRRFPPLPIAPCAPFHSQYYSIYHREPLWWRKYSN